ncbi:MAG: IPTL-CTERM sorting domain-containing protein [Bacteroidota bacterium]
MKRKSTFFIAFLLLGFLSFQTAYSQCFELGSPVGELTPVLKNPIGFCPGIAEPADVCDCPTGFVAVGYEGEEGNVYGAMVLSNFTLRCKELLPDGSLGPMVEVTCANGTAAGNTPDGPIDAAAGEALVGFEVRIGCATDAVMGESKPVLDIAAGLPNTTSNGMTGIGGTGGSPQPVMYVPNGNVIVGMQTYIEPLNQPVGAQGITAGVAWRYAPIIACPLNCSVDGISVGNISACDDNGTPDPSDDTFTADVTVTFTDAPASGTLDLSGDGSASVAVGSLGAGSYVFTSVSMSADGTAIDLTATFSADPACSLNNANAGTAPAACSVSAACAITGITSANISACDNNGTPNLVSDDTFTADVTVTFSNPPGSGTLDLSGDGTASVAVGSIGATTHTFTGVTMTADGQPIGLTASFSADAACLLSVSNTGQAPNQCSVNVPPGSIPTMSEWGLILFALIIFTFSVVMGTQHQQSLSMAGNHVATSSGKRLPFNKALYFKVLPFVYLGFVLVFGAAITMFGYELTNADVPGSLLSGLVIAYLVHFVMMADANNKS